MADENKRHLKTLYPTAAFPSKTHSDGKESKVVFSDYGCFEAVDVDHSEVEPRIFVKRHRLAPDKTNGYGDHQSTKTVDSRVLCPEHDLMMLGQPDPVPILLPEDITFSDLYSMQQVPKPNSSRKKQVVATDVKDHYYNLGWDHGDVTVKTFLELMHYSFQESAKEDGESKMEKSVLNRSKAFGVSGSYLFNKKFDSSLCDVGCGTLNNTILEGIQSQGADLYSNSDYTGGCLSYQSIEQSLDKQFGFLACAQGQGLEEFAIKLLSTSLCDEQQEDGDNYIDSTNKNFSALLPSVNVMSEYRQTLNGRILQTQTVTTDDPEVFLLGIRSDYHVLLDKLDTKKLEWNLSENTAKFNSDDAVSSIGCLKSKKKFTSVALSPYIAGECTFATENHVVQLWSPHMPSQTGSNDSVGRVLMDGCVGGLRSSDLWRQVVYAAHPRQLYVADTGNVCIFDLRTQYDSISLLNISSSEHTKENERIYSIISGRNINNEFQCFIATDYHLFLMDQRFCREPLAQWGTNMSLPPLYISPVHVAETESSASEFSMHNWSCSTKAVLLGGQCSQEVYCYQFCNTTQLGEKPKVYPPQGIGPPRILGSFRDVWKQCRTKPSKHSSYLESRLSMMLVGLDAIPMVSKAAVVMLQMNSVGDIGYQTLSLRSPEEVYNMNSILTGETSSCMSSYEERAKKTALEKAQRQNYDHWVECVCSSLKDEEKITCLNKDITLYTTKCFLWSRARKELSKIDLVLNDRELCEFCRKNRFENSADSDTVEKPPTGICSICGYSIKTSTKIWEFFKHEAARSTMFTRAVLLSCENAEDKLDQEIEDLNLIKIETTANDEENENEDQELGRLLKETWSGTYQEYWEELDCRKKNRQNEEKKKLKRRTFDLGQQQENEMSESLSTTLSVKQLKELNSNCDRLVISTKEHTTPKAKALTQPASTLQSWLTPHSKFNSFSQPTSRAHFFSQPTSHEQNKLSPPSTRPLPELRTAVNDSISRSPLRKTLIPPLPSFSSFSPKRKLFSPQSKLKHGSKIREKWSSVRGRSKRPKISGNQMGF